MKLLEYALNSIFRRRWKHLFVLLVFTLLMSAAFSIFMVTSALKAEVQYSSDNLPDILVQEHAGGRQQYIDEERLTEIALLPGVTSAKTRIWGYYPFDYINTNLTVVGLDVFDPHLSKTIEKTVNDGDLQLLRRGEGIFIGEKLKDILLRIYNKEEFSFQTKSGEYITLKVSGTFKSESQMLSTGVVIAERDTAASILGIEEGYVTDIAVTVSNSQEISTIAEKIENISPSYRVFTREVIEASYQNMFDYKSGIFLFFFMSCIFTFFMIVFDRLSGLTGEEEKEISILKAVGWSTGDVLTVKLYESAVTGLTSFAASVLLSMIYVYLLQSPGLKDIFIGYSYLKPHFQLIFYPDIKVFVTVFLLTVPIYWAAVTIPAWRAASKDSGEVLR